VVAWALAWFLGLNVVKHEKVFGVFCCRRGGGYSVVAWALGFFGFERCEARKVLGVFWVDSVVGLFGGGLIAAWSGFSADLSSSLFRRGGGNGVRYIICIRVDFVLIVAVCVLGLRMC
jgi:hypothetical protein